MAWLHSSTIATRTWQRSQERFVRDPEGGPESRLWSADAGRVQGRTNSPAVEEGQTDLRRSKGNRNQAVPCKRDALLQEVATDDSP